MNNIFNIRKKRILSILMLTLLAMSFLFSFAACGDNDGINEGQTPESTHSKAMTDETDKTEAQETAEKEKILVPDFTLMDQNGVERSLSDYRGQYVMLNFWATWCRPCQMELPDFQQFYLDNGENEDDFVVIGVASPASDQNKYTREKDLETVINFIQEQNLSYPTLMDTSGEIFAMFGINSIPMTFFIDHEGYLFTYVPGVVSRTMMDTIAEHLRSQ